MGVPEPNPAAPFSASPDVGALLGRAVGGDVAAFAGLVRLHQSAVFSLALRLLGTRADAEEAAQDAFLKLHAELASISDAPHLRHWLLRTTSHRCIDRLRQRGRRPATSGALPVDVADEAAWGADGTDPLLARRVHHLLGALAAPARAVLLLRFQEDLDPGEIATALDMPVNTVKSHLRRSLDWLRAQLPEKTP
jgi:RNA polymerase sigma-70 factor, ECF subfamily